MKLGYKQYFLGDKVGKKIMQYEVHEDLGSALNSQRKRHNNGQRLTVYGVHDKTNELLCVANKLPKNF